MEVNKPNWLQGYKVTSYLIATNTIFNFAIFIVKSVIYIYVYILLNNYSLMITTDLLLFLGLILIINVYNFLNSRISRNNL